MWSIFRPGILSKIWAKGIMEKNLSRGHVTVILSFIPHASAVKVYAEKKRFNSARKAYPWDKISLTAHTQ